MKDKTLLEEIKKENTAEIEKKFAEIKEESQKEANKENVRAFSSSSFPAIELERLRQKYKKEEDEEVNKIESKVGSVIETPNYDNLETLSESERKKIFVVTKDAPKKKVNRVKVFIISILFAIFSVWGIINISLIDNVSNQISELSTTYYDVNLPSYLRNLTMLDATNSENMENLFETIPDESNPPTKIEESSNWFDRFCDFLRGLIGG